MSITKFVVEYVEQFPIVHSPNPHQAGLILPSWQNGLWGGGDLQVYETHYWIACSAVYYGADIFKGAQA
jgi:hypothetical protein